MGVKRGLDLVLVRNTGTFVAPVWTVVGNVKDLALDRSMAEGDASSRQNDVEMKEPCLEAASFQWAMVDESTDADLIAIETAYAAREKIEFAFIDGAPDDPATEGIRYECKIFNVSEPQPLNDVNVVNVTAKPCYTTNQQGTAFVPVEA